MISGTREMHVRGLTVKSHVFPALSRHLFGVSIESKTRRGGEPHVSSDACFPYSRRLSVTRSERGGALPFSSLVVIYRSRDRSLGFIYVWLPG